MLGDQGSQGFAGKRVGLHAELAGKQLPVGEPSNGAGEARCAHGCLNIVH